MLIEATSSLQPSRWIHTVHSLFYDATYHNYKNVILYVMFIHFKWFAIYILMHYAGLPKILCNAERQNVRHISTLVVNCCYSRQNAAMMSWKCQLVSIQKWLSLTRAEFNKGYLNTYMHCIVSQHIHCTYRWNLLSFILHRQCCGCWYWLGSPGISHFSS